MKMKQPRVFLTNFKSFSSIYRYQWYNIDLLDKFPICVFNLMTPRVTSI